MKKMKGVIRMKGLFPLSSMAKNLTGLIVSLVIYLGLGAVIGWVCGALGGIPVIRILAQLIGTVIGIYLLVGAIISVVVFLQNKDK